jgi:hypothetical protein
VTQIPGIKPYVFTVIIFFLCASIAGCNAYTAPATTITSTTQTTTLTTPTETILTYKTTPGGIEYATGKDGDMKYVESKDRNVRVLAPVGVSDKNMEFYLDRTYQANDFVAGFFDNEPKLPQLVIVSYDGKRWTAINNPEKSYGWIPSVFPWNISYFTVKNHNGVVHVITGNWVDVYLGTEEPAHEFFAYYLGNAAAFKESGGSLDNFTLKNAKTVFNHGSYFDENNVLTPDAVSTMELTTGDPVAWAFGFQLKLEENDSLGYLQIRQLAKLLNDKYTPGDNLNAEDYLAAEKELLSNVSGATSP